MKEELIVGLVSISDRASAVAIAWREGLVRA